MEYRVKLDFFEGPLDLLLHLIRKNEFDIFDIPIARLTDEYFQYIELMQELDINIAGEFLVYASTLMYLKSRSLLPANEKTEEQIIEEEEELQILKEKLVEYEKFKQAATELARRQREENELFSKEVPPELVKEKQEEQSIEANLFDLLDAFAIILKEISKPETIDILDDEVTVNEKITAILDILKKHKKISFSSLFYKARTRYEMVVIFLALLELIRLREIMVKQRAAFGEIWIYMNSVRAPL
ncbi:MAG TPA: hypothetical protein EYP78_07000 [Candidatus Omnitrophica bacterium]|nr:hypothetical protein [Candidatus Omnitrophota bacterium]